MKKLYCTKLDRPHEESEHCADSCVAVYLASEVDARIAELEDALRSLRKVAHREVSPKYSATLDEAFSLADVVLGDIPD